MSIPFATILIFVLMLLVIFIDTLYQYILVPFEFPWNKKRWNKSIFPKTFFTWKIESIFGINTPFFDAPHTYQAVVVSGFGIILYLYGKHISAPQGLLFWFDALLYLMWLFLLFYRLRNLSLRIFKRRK